jgi:transposase
MEQRAVIRFFTLKGLGVQQIHSELESVYHKEALTFSTGYKWFARFRVGRTKLSNDPRSRRPRESDGATGISAMLEERPFVSCKLIARQFRVAKTTCLRMLREDLGLKKFHLR